MPTLPTPSPDALAHSNTLRKLIQDEILTHEGWITFRRFMELALYAPGLGYYSGGAVKFGAAGDFITAPELSPLFGRALSCTVAPVLTETRGDILELGPGSGRLAIDMLRELEANNCLPGHYYMLEVSAALQSRQQQAIQQQVPHLAPRVHWLTQLPREFSGVIVANEVFDALPAAVIHWKAQTVFERGVALHGGEFIWCDKNVTSTELLQVAQTLSPAKAYVSEISLAARGLITSLALILQQGVILVLDYGFPKNEYYHPQRREGTLMCHYRHHAHDNPFYLPGLQDITVHVDFSALAQAGTEQGLTLAGYTSQAQFLINNGILELLSAISPDNPEKYLPLSGQVKKLLSPAEMGELFKVLALGRGVAATLPGFTANDRSYLL